jgi:tRNA dimethylallyltransferase
MFSSGLYEEFRSLIDRGYHRESPGLCCLGYRELFAVYEDGSSMEAARDTIKRNTRKFAKRQMTWLRNRVDAVLFDAAGRPYPAVREKVSRFLSGS